MEKQTPWEAFRFLFRDPAWKRKLWGGFWRTILILPAPIVLGYSLEVMRRSMRDHPTPLPEWSELTHPWWEGMRFALISLIYYLPIFIGAGLWSVETEQIWPWELVIYILSPGVAVSLALSRTWRSGFRLDRAFRLMREPKAFIQAVGASILLEYIPMMCFLALSLGSSGLVLFAQPSSDLPSLLNKAGLLVLLLCAIMGGFWSRIGQAWAYTWLWKMAGMRVEETGGASLAPTFYSSVAAARPTVAGVPSPDRPH